MAAISTGSLASAGARPTTTPRQPRPLHPDQAWFDKIYLDAQDAPRADTRAKGARTPFAHSLQTIRHAIATDVSRPPTDAKTPNPKGSGAVASGGFLDGLVSNKATIVEKRGAYYNPKTQVTALEALLKKLPKPGSPAPSRARRRRPGTARQLDVEQTQAMVDAYRAGCTVYQLGDRFGIDRRTVGKILTRNGVQTKHPGLTIEDINQAARLYEAGWSLARIGEHLGVTATTVHRRLRKRGIAMRAANGATR